MLICSKLVNILSSILPKHCDQLVTDVCIESEGRVEQTIIELENVPITLTISPFNDVPVVRDSEIPRKRRRRVPARYHDTLPTSLPSLSETPVVTKVILQGNALYQTVPNTFGLFRRYKHCPSYDPDGEVTLEELAGSFATSEAEESHQNELPSVLCGPSTHEPFYPFPNISTFMLSEWYYNSPSGERSGPDFNRLVSVLSDKRFTLEEVIGFNAKTRDKLLDQGNNAVNGDMECTEIGGWACNVPVTIQIPEGNHRWSNDEGRTFSVPGLHHRSITEIIQSVFETNRHLHYTPFELWWQPDPDIPPQRIYSDISCSQAFHDAHHEVNENPDFHVPGCTLEKTVAAIMIYSDSTHLAQFGTAKLWPIYVFAGNLDKWFRSKPSTHSCEHWAYIPSVSV